MNNKERRKGLGEFIALDNSALIYPPTEAAYNANTFRISIDLRVPIEVAILRTALDQVSERCPYMMLELKKGFFWYYLTANDRQLPLWPEGSYPAGRMDFVANNHFLIKVIYSERRIGVECFHALTDGGGALAYLKLLVERYAELSGLATFSFTDGLKWDSKAAKEEFSDPFQTLYDPKVRAPKMVGRAYHRKGSPPRSQAVKVIRAQMPSIQVRERAKSRGLTIGEYFSAVYLYTLQELQQKERSKKIRRRPIRLSVPMNLRRIFGIETMRNFTLFALIGLEGGVGHHDFEEICKQVQLQMGLQSEKKQLLRQIKRNVAGQRNALMRFVPNWLKNPLFKLLSDALGDHQYSGIISNLGQVQLPDALKPYVEAMDFHLSPGSLNPVSVAVVGYHDRLAINFSSFLDRDTELERQFLTFMVEDGVEVSVATNREDR
ncbi:MAG: hypothetical protein GX938_02430 [Spirochaetales bacterium]|nr:hypothetical protein [Spirochaetales bacterium]